MIRFFTLHRERFLLLSFGIIYLWFGMLKFFPGLSPAEALAKETLWQLTFHTIPVNISYFLLATWEVSIGILLLLGYRKKWMLLVVAVHLVFTFAPLVILPAISYRGEVFSLSLVGQYIVKNLILFFALFFLLPEKK